MTQTLPPPELPGFTPVGAIEGGEGGYAKVYLYEQQAPRRPVAVKVLRGRGLEYVQYQAILDEATAMARLGNHQHIVTVIEAKMSVDGQPCIVMMYCGGPNLMRLVTDGMLSVRRVVRLGMQLAGVVQAAHDAGIVHRDIKPANILTDEFDNPRLADFGIAGRLGSVDNDDRPTGLSLPWCPPEILAGAAGSAASDVFSLGATLWHLLAGRSPFDVPGHNSRAELEARIADPRPGPTGRPDVPARLEQLLAAMMAADPGRRPRSAAAVAAELSLVEQEIGAPRPGEGWHVDLPRPVLSAPARPDLQATVAPAARHAGLAGPGAYAQASPRPSGAPPTSPPIGSPVPLVAAGTLTAQGGRSDAALPLQTELRSKPAAVDVAPGGAAPPTQHERRNKWQLIAAVVVVLLSGVVVIATKPWQRAQDPSGPSTVDDSGPGAVGGGAGQQGDSLPPGIPTLTFERVDAQTVRFEWTYTAPLDSDTYQWRRTGPDGVPATDPVEVVDDPAVAIASPVGTELCIQVKVVRLDGSYASVAWSPTLCGA